MTEHDIHKEALNWIVKNSKELEESNLSQDTKVGLSTLLNIYLANKTPKNKSSSKLHFFLIGFESAEELPREVLNNYISTAIKRWSLQDSKVDWFDGIPMPNFAVEYMGTDMDTQDLKGMVQHISVISKRAKSLFMRIGGKRT